MQDDSQRIGFFKISRHFLQSELMDKSPLHFKMWVWMVARANYRDGGGLQRGQLRTTIREMREALGYRAGFCKKLPTVKEVRCAYTSFMNDELIRINRTTHGMVITILNYDVYQSDSPSRGTRAGTRRDNWQGTQEGMPEHDTTDRDYEENEAPEIGARHTAGHTGGHEAGHLGGENAKVIPIIEKNKEYKKYPPYNPPLGGNGGVGKVGRVEKVKIPPWIPPDLWTEFKRHRYRLKAPMTPYAEKRAIIKLRQLKDDGYDPEAVINKSIECGWKGLFPIKEESTEDAFRQFQEEHRAAEQAHR